MDFAKLNRYRDAPASKPPTIPNLLRNHDGRAVPKMVATLAFPPDPVTYVDDYYVNSYDFRLYRRLRIVKPGNGSLGVACWVPVSTPR